MTSALDNTNVIVNAICKLGEDKISQALGEKKKIGITKLADDIAKDLNLKSPLCYHILSLYISNREDIHVKLGKNGGIVPLDVKVP